MREFKRYEKAFAMVNGKRRLVMVYKQSPTWTKASLCGVGRGHCSLTWVRVKTNDLLPLPTLNQWSW